MKVFISHSAKNKEEAARLRDDLAGEKIKTWLDRDELRGGEPLIDELQEALASSTHLILLWSKPASESRYVSAEWQAAYDLGKVIISCTLDPTPLPLFLRRFIFYDMSGPYTEALAQILEELGRTVPKKAATKKTASKKPATKRGSAPDKDDVIDRLARGQNEVVVAMYGDDLPRARRLQAGLDPLMNDALRRWRADDVVLNLGGYNLKNAYLLKHRGEMSPGVHPPDPLLAQAERLFHAALGIEPDDASAKNGLGNVYWLRGDLDAAEFFVAQALEKARKSGFRYEAAESDLEGIRREKASRAAGRRRSRK
jgi:tetratricopeptide (TPR) repeat protein